MSLTHTPTPSHSQAEHTTKHLHLGRPRALQTLGTRVTKQTENVENPDPEHTMQQPDLQ